MQQQFGFRQCNYNTYYVFYQCFGFVDIYNPTSSLNPLLQ